MVRPLVEYLQSGEAELVMTESHINNAKSRFTEEITTVTGSFANIHESVERNQKQSTNARQLSFGKMGRLGNLMVLLVVLMGLAGVAYFCFRFFNRSVLC